MLLTLADGDRHAYGIKKELASGQAYRDIGPGTLYRTIDQLIAAGFIEETDRRPAPELDDERRRYYRLTPFGRKVAAAEAERLAELVKAARLRRLVGGVSRA
jgi:DNA-binding PadR family transcriptional regulator